MATLYPCHLNPLPVISILYPCHLNPPPLSSQPSTPVISTLYLAISTLYPCHLDRSSGHRPLRSGETPAFAFVFALALALALALAPARPSKRRPPPRRRLHPTGRSAARALKAILTLPLSFRPSTPVISTLYPCHLDRSSGHRPLRSGETPAFAFVFALALALALAQQGHQSDGLRREDAFIQLVEVQREHSKQSSLYPWPSQPSTPAISTLYLSSRPSTPVISTEAADTVRCAVERPPHSPLHLHLHLHLHQQGHQSDGLRREDVFIQLVEVQRKHSKQSSLRPTAT
jgi:hypothetical protein